MRRIAAIVVVLLLVLCCLAAVVGGWAYFFRVPAVEARPVVLIGSPGYGEQVEVGQGVMVQAVARDETGVVRVELWADGELEESQGSSWPGGVTPFPFTTNWQPLSPGIHTLVVRAFNDQGARAHALVNVEAVALPDRDGDGIADEVDSCPDEAGLDDAEGCPDRDRDGIPDGTDACPDEAGLPQGDGCPSPAESDRDGDGLLDAGDLCPDEPGPPRVGGCPDGDGDGVADADDACPTEPGLPEQRGCTVPGDMDGDGVSDGDDACPAEPGLVELDGCPDFDGDAIPDGRDACPDEWGAREDGCPDRDLDGVADEDDLRPDDPGVGDEFGSIDTDAPDLDGDGIPDEADRCPEEEGLLEDGGCPPPDAGDADADGTADVDEAPWGGSPDWNIQPLWPTDEPLELGPMVEFQALEFELFEDYDRAYCYASLGHEAEERFPEDPDQYFSPGEERHWNIDEHLGHRFVALAEDEPLRVHVDCFALGGLPGEQPLVDLGSFERYHERSEGDWDGHVIEGFSNPGPEGDQFRVEYRICEGSCEEALFAPPSLALITFGPVGEGPVMLHWNWDGDEEQISGFRVYVNGAFVRAVGTDVRLFADYHEHEITDLWPSCGERMEFEVTAYSGAAGVPERESPRSNPQVWEGEDCQRTVLVTFLSLETSGLGSRKGPIKGTFLANDQTLFPDWRGRPPTFDSTDDTRRYLEPGRTYDLADLFDDIETEGLSCLGGNCTDNYAPEINFVEVELGPHDSLTFGGNIWDDDGHRIFDGSDSIRPGEIIPGPHSVVDRGIELTVLIDVLVGPEAGDRPDLVISDISLQPESNQLRVELFNRAAFLENGTVTIRAERLNGELLDTSTWSNMSIGSGERQVLGTSLVLDSSPIYDLRLILDPDDVIEETEEGELNNVYETPALMRVEFTELAAYPCESFLSTTSDHWFLLWVGHGPSRGEVQWVGDRMRYPWAGTLELDTYLDVSGDDPDWFAHWHPSEDEPGRFIVEFEMPLDENLYVLAAGYEDDALSDDMLGSVYGEYGPEVNYGHRDDTYHERSPNQGCDEGAPLGWDYFGFDAWWRITRVH
jgi:hypothetical protein